LIHQFSYTLTEKGLEEFLQQKKKVVDEPKAFAAKIRKTTQTKKQNTPTTHT